MEKKIFNTSAYQLKEIPADAPELFHYTDAGAFLGVTQHKTVWMSNINYQNDAEEYYYIFKRTEEILRQKYPGLMSDNYTLLPARISTVFTFSLSQKQDMLSQWRGYCPDGGFCLSFNKEHLNAAIKREDMVVAKCIYNLAEQEEFIINNIIGFTPDEYQESQPDGGGNVSGDARMRIHYLFKKIHTHLDQAAPLLKHPSFSEEEEWRIFKSIDHSTDDLGLARAIRHYPPHEISQIKFRQKKSLLIPYIEFKLEEVAAPITNHISEVIVSPTPHKNLALESCNALLKLSECSMNAKNSKIPYVNW